MKSEEFSWKNQLGTRSFVQEWSPEGEARAAIGLVHGLGEHTGRYDHVARRLTAAGYAMVGMDLPGHGRTEGTRGCTSYDGACAEIDRLLKALEKRHPGKPRFLYGHSLGGVLVLYYVLSSRPALRGAIVTSPLISTGQPVPAVKVWLAKLMARLKPDFSFRSGLDQARLSRDPQVIQAYRQDPLVHDRVSAILGLDMISRGAWILERAREFPLPLLLMQGGADRLVSVAATERLAGAIPAGRLTYQVWEGLYHEAHNEPEQEQVIQAMRDWLDRQMQAG
jgi:alpha-beta hydrolase superfamily lysophospholipase